MSVNTALHAIVEREGRTGMAQACFEFLPTHAEVDLPSWPEMNIVNGIGSNGQRK
jgi:ribonuclease D